MLIPPRRVLADVQMKTNRAQVHFDTLQTELDKWLHNPKSCTIREGTDFEKQVHIFQIEIAPLPEIIPGVLGDFVCCLRSSLDQLAWGLAHIWPSRKFTRTEERRIQFPIFEERNATYEDRIKLFPPAVATVIDSLQPYLRGNAFRDDPLWKLNELWTMDKHRAIPMNSNALAVNFPAPVSEWEQYVRHFNYHVEVHFPLMMFLSSKVHLKPRVAVEILFGEYMGSFAVSRVDLRDINNFVTKEVIPKFTGFLP